MFYIISDNGVQKEKKNINSATDTESTYCLAFLTSCSGQALMAQACITLK